jgi:hypothetical protein
MIFAAGPFSVGGVEKYMTARIPAPTTKMATSISTPTISAAPLSFLLLMDMKKFLLV